MNDKAISYGMFLFGLIILLVSFFLFYQSKNEGVEKNKEEDKVVELILDTNTKDYSNLIVVTAPQPNTKIQKPLKITGRARGYWFFEATFPIEALDSNGIVIAQGYAQADDEWMTEDFVPFTSNLVINVPVAGNGTLRLKKSNPSALPENDDMLEIAIVY